MSAGDQVNRGSKAGETTGMHGVGSQEAISDKGPLEPGPKKEGSWGRGIQLKEQQEPRSEVQCAYQFQETS